ncbi:hypothetical protein [Actinomadura rubrisoli]|uniref:hypothetical protein n=1 Tax=Actinomadura rubrisoli TaxID=2530368 RepID=UPI001FB6CF8A|nr:hypothetical protein [Actinomadura rubrisoli]
MLVLTPQDAVNDRIAGLDEGADDYLSKPFDLGELVVARVRALLRRSRPVRRGVRRSHRGRGDPDGLARRAQDRVHTHRVERAGGPAGASGPDAEPGQIGERVWSLGSGPRPTRWGSTPATCTASSKAAANRGRCIRRVGSATGWARRERRRSDGAGRGSTRGWR